MSFFTEFLADAKQRVSYWIIAAKSDFATTIWREMQRQGIGKKQLAEKMGVSPSMMTRIMKGDHNVTIETMAKAAFALDMQLDIQLKSKAPKEHRRADLLFFDKPFASDASNDEKFTPLVIEQHG